MEIKDRTYTINISRRAIIKVIIAAVVVAALWELKHLVFVILTSVVLASFIRTAAEYVNKRFRLNRIVSVVTMYLLTFLVFAGIFYFFLPLLISEFANLIPVLTEYFPQGLPIAQDVDLELLGQVETVAPGGTVEIGGLVESLRSFIGVIASGFGNTLSTLFGGLLNVVLVAIISFYLSVSRDGIESFLRMVSPIHNEAYVIDVWKRSQKKIALWMQGQMILGIVVGLLTFLGLSLLGIKNALLLSVIAAIFELIPFGIFLAAIPAVSLAFGAGGFSLALMVVALYLIIQQLEGYLLAPLVVNKMTGVSPLVVILSVLIGVGLAGFWGLILAVPVAVTVLEYINDLEKERLVKMQNE